MQRVIKLWKVSETFGAKQFVCKNGKKIHRTRATFILSNPFYYGHFRYSGEIYEGKHEPMVAKKLWDQVQEVMRQRDDRDIRVKLNHRHIADFWFARLVDDDHWRIQGKDPVKRHATFLHLLPLHEKTERF